MKEFAMYKLAYLCYFSLFSVLSVGTISSDEHGGIHIHLKCGEEIEDEVKTPEYCVELKPWYHNQHYDEYEHIEDQADRLQDDTTWPSHREDYSDILMR
jgi:hypothetical protein